MAERIVITEKIIQAKGICEAVGSRYGAILPAEDHLFDLLKPADGGNKASKLKALRAAKRVWLATDCDREGQLIGQEVLEYYGYRGEVQRAMFTAHDARTIRDAFTHAWPNSHHAALYQAAVAPAQADQIYNWSLTRTATVSRAKPAP